MRSVGEDVGRCGLEQAAPAAARVVRVVVESPLWACDRRRIDMMGAQEVAARTAAERRKSDAAGQKKPTSIESRVAITELS